MGKSRWSRRSPRYAASANGRCSTQSKQNSGSSYRGCGAIRLAAVLLSFTMASRNSGSLFFSASVDGTHGGRKTVCVCPMNESLLSAMQRRSAATDAARCYCWWMQVSPQAKLAQAVAVGCCRSALVYSLCVRRCCRPTLFAACLLSARQRRRVDFRGRRTEPTTPEQRSLTNAAGFGVRRPPAGAGLGAWLGSLLNDFRSHLLAILRGRECLKEERATDKGATLGSCAPSVAGCDKSYKSSCSAARAPRWAAGCSSRAPCPTSLG